MHCGRVRGGDWLNFLDILPARLEKTRMESGCLEGFVYSALPSWPSFLTWGHLQLLEVLNPFQPTSNPGSKRAWEPTLLPGKTHLLCLVLGDGFFFF